MSKQKVCECFDRYGESHPDCEWLFTKKHRNERHCDPCKKMAHYLRRRNAQRRYKKITTMAGLEALTFTWLASHIDLECGNCGQKGVPIQNRVLCVPCFTSPEAREMAAGAISNIPSKHLHNHDLISEHMVELDSFELNYQEPSVVHIYKDKNTSQERLQKLVDECR